MYVYVCLSTIMEAKGGIGSRRRGLQEAVSADLNAGPLWKSKQVFFIPHLRVTSPAL